MVQTDAKRNANFCKDQLMLFISVTMSSKIRTRMVATGLNNMEIGLTSVGTDSVKGVREKAE